MRGVSRPVNKLPVSSQPPNIMLSKDLVSPSDVKFVSFIVEVIVNTVMRYFRFELLNLEL